MMPAGTAHGLSDISETLLIPLYVRAKESERPDALIHDGKAARMVQRIDYPFSKIRIQEHDEVGILLRVREFDRRARCFLQEHRNAVVVHIGCGLDTRFERGRARCWGTTPLAACGRGNCPRREITVAMPWKPSRRAPIRTSTMVSPEPIRAMDCARAS